MPIIVQQHKNLCTTSENLFSVDATQTESKPHQLELPLSCSADHFDMVANGHSWGNHVLWSRLGIPKLDQPGQFTFWKSLPQNLAAARQIVSEFDGVTDVFLTPNQFKGWRKLNLGKSLNSLYVDIDIPKKYLDEGGLTATSTYWAEKAMHLLSQGDVPFVPPNVLVHSGRGVHLYWLLEKPVPFSALPRWQQIQNVLTEVVEGDKQARDATRVLRVIGSKNSKNRQPVTGEWVTQTRYSFEYLYECFVGERKKKSATVSSIEKARAEKGLRPATGSIYKRWYLVYQDIWTIAKDLNKRGITLKEIHKHNYFLWVAANALAWFSPNLDTIKDDCVDLGKKLCPGKPESEILESVASVLHRAQKQAPVKAKQAEEETLFDEAGNHLGLYRFKRTTLYERFKEYIPDELIDELRAIVPDDVIRQRKTERERTRKHESGEVKMTRAEYESKNDGVRQQALILLAQGAKPKTVSEHLNTPLKTIYRWRSDEKQKNSQVRVLV